ncbi:MAG: ferrous iron transport protein A [Chloroflexi bacterium]|nr:ferrous iron transport protein A [Chloroflexota bacterium]
MSSTIEFVPGCPNQAAGDSALICPLSKVRAGVAVRIKQLPAAPEVRNRLREIGFCEEQIIKLITSQANIICQVCNARLAVSSQLAQTILVEPLTFRKAA